MILEINNKKYGGWEKATLFRSVQTLSDRCLFETSNLGGLFSQTKAGDIARVFIKDTLMFTGFVFKKYVDLKGKLILDVRDNTAKLLKLTLQPGGSEFFGINTRDLLSEITGLTVSGEAGETMRHVRLNIDMPLVSILQNFADRAALIARADTTGGINLSKVNRTSSNLILKEGLSIFTANHSEEWQPTATDQKSFSSNDFSAATILSGSGETVINIDGGSLTTGETQNIGLTRLGRLNLLDVVSISVDPYATTYETGNIVNIDISSLNLRESRIINTVEIKRHGDEFSQILELVPVTSYA